MKMKMKTLGSALMLAGLLVGTAQTALADHPI